MKTLMDSNSGAYLVTTDASTYLVDLDRRVIRRTRTQNVDGWLLRRDDELVMFVELHECAPSGCVLRCCWSFGCMVCP